MHTWQVQTAQAKFADFLDACVHEGPQRLARKGVDVAVLISIADWRHMQEANGPSLKALLQTATGAPKSELPLRGKAKRRPPSPLR